ncbi:efflux RND transporter periplasmic adaptor subunit [Moraxella oblonga]|uniref:efflux RND transporter periplasmic adaptor subunit n=1 Tax=Moraxella oblonga TaxID=200413 RepID=UPI0008364F32|nr:efflux RND transporter periplasmic adaptor subunit [Moraxella oblonga]
MSKKIYTTHLIRTSKIVCFSVSLLFLMSTSSHATNSEFGCMLRPMQTVDIRSPIVGILSNINVERGAYVKKGQVIAQLDSQVEQATVNAAKYRYQTSASITAAQNKVNSAKSKADRMKKLADAQFMSKQAYEDAYQEYQAAQAELLAAQESQTQAKYEYQAALSELNRRTITSPISGIVTARYLDKGAVVSPTDGKFPIMTIAQTDRLKVQIIAPVKYFKQLKQGSQLTITPEKPFNNPIKMTVAIKDGSVDAASGTFSMIGYINNTNNKIPSGILCSVNL